MPGPDELVDRAWEVHDADLAAGRRFRGMTRRLPSLMYRVGQLAWQASHLDCAVTVSCDVVAGLLSAFGLLATTRVLTTLLDSGPTPARVRAALPTLLFVLAVIVVQMALNLTAGWTENRLLPEVTRITERRLFAATTQVDLAAFDAPGFYDSLQRARDRGLSEATRGVELAVGILTGVARLAAALSVLLVLSPVLLPLLAVAAVPDAWAAVRIAKMRYLTSYELAVSRRRKWILADLMADRRAAAEVRSFNMHGFLLRTYDTLAGYERGVRLALARRQSLVTLAGEVAAGIGLGLVYLALGILLSVGWIALPVAGTAALAIRSAVSSLSRLLVSVNQCFESGLYFSDYLDFCADAERNIPGPGSLAAPRGFRTISASHVTFAYPGSSRNALTDVSIDIHQGEVVALVGENGSGKTTLAKLLAGLYEPSRGVIRWDGEPLVDVDREGLRERIAVIMQDYTRWPMTALENITMGSDRDERLLAMATAAPVRTGSSKRCPRAATPIWTGVSGAARTCPAASGSASRSRAASTGTPPCSSATSPRRPWTRGPSTPCSRGSARTPRGGPCCSSPTGWPASARPTISTCSTTGEWPSRAVMSGSWPTRACTRICTPCRPRRTTWV